MIQVIWIDDNSLDYWGAPTEMANMVMDEAYDYGIEITPYSTYKEGLAALWKEPSRWNAIILDVRDERAQKDDEVEGFHWAQQEIHEFWSKQNRKDPYLFVFSGVDQYVSNGGSLIRKRDYARKRVYAKPSEANLMFEDIQKVMEVSDLYQIKKKYEDVFDAIQTLNWSEEERTRLFTLIYSIEKENERRNDQFFNDIRKLLEGPVIKALSDLSIFSKEIKSLNERCKFVGKRNFMEHIPVYIQRSFHSLADISNNASHATDHSTEKKHLCVTSDVIYGKAPYLLKSCLYELLNIIIWQMDFCKRYTDIEENIKIFSDKDK